MQYFYPSDWTENGQESSVKQKLSDKDKAFMRASYPENAPWPGVNNKDPQDILVVDLQNSDTQTTPIPDTRDPIKTGLIVTVSVMALGVVVSLIIMLVYVHRCKSKNLKITKSVEMSNMNRTSTF